MANETKANNIKDLRKSINSAKVKAKAEKVEKEEAVTEVKEVPAKITPVKKEVAPKAEPIPKEELEDEEELDDEDEERELTEEEIVKMIRQSLPDAPEKYEPSPFLKQLLDSNNTEPIEFEDATGEIIAFEQVALIPKDDKLYAILKPIDFESFNIKEDEALVYSVEYDMYYYEDYLERVTDEVDIEIIFQMYYDLCDEQGIE